MPAAGAAVRCSWIVTGWRSISAASAAIGGGIVALKKSVCRLVGRYVRMRRIREEAHVEHAIGLVEHEMLEVTQSSRRSNACDRAGGPASRRNRVDAALECVLARPHAVPPCTAAPVTGMCNRQGVEVVEHLGGELARRRQHQRPRRPARLVDQSIEDRQQERRRLAAAGRADQRNDILPLPRQAGGIASAWMGVGRANPNSLIPWRREGWRPTWPKGTDPLSLIFAVGGSLLADGSSRPAARIQANSEQPTLPGSPRYSNVEP